MKKVVIAVLIIVITTASSVFAINPTGAKNFSVELGHEYSESEWKRLEEMKEVTEEEEASLVVIKKQQYLQIKYHRLATEENDGLIGDLSVFGRLGNAQVKILGMCYRDGCTDMFVTDPELAGAKPYFDSKGIMFGTLGARLDFYTEKSPFSISLSIYGTQYQNYEDVNQATITTDPPAQFIQRITVKKHGELVSELMVQYKFKRKVVIYGGTGLHLAEACLQESRSISDSYGNYYAVTYPEFTVREQVLSGNLGIMVPIYKSLGLDVEVGVKFGSLFYGKMLNVALNYTF